MSLLSSLGSTGTLLAITVGMLAAVACTKPKEEALSQTTTTSASVRALASCDTSAETGSCTDYSSATGSFQLERSLCRSARGSFALNVCPTSKRIGACVIDDSEVKRYYEGAGGFTPDAARADCEQSGLKGRFVSTSAGASSGLATR